MLDWRDAEALAAWHMRALGFDDAAVTGGGADGGLDVVAEDAAAQVKHYSDTNIGSPAVQQARGAAHGRQWTLFYALSGYTKAALEYADQAKVALFFYDTQGAVRAANEPAVFLVTSAGLDSSSRADRFGLEQEAATAGQKYFDACWERYSSIARLLIAEARGRRTRAVKLLTIENAAVERLITDLGSNRLPISEFMHKCQLILDSAQRLERARN